MGDFLSFLWPSQKSWTLLLKMAFSAFSVITDRVNISWRERVVWSTGTGGLQNHKCLIFDVKQHPKNIWFHGCQNHPWLLFLSKHPESWFCSEDPGLEFLTVELPYLWVIAQIFRQIRFYSSKFVLFVLFEDFLLKNF